MRYPLLTSLLAPLLCSAIFAQTPLTTVRIATGLDSPVFLTAAPGDDSRLFVLEQNVGRIRVIKDGQLLSQPFLDISSKSSFGGERGLLGLAFHPNYETNGYFFIDYTDWGGATIVERYRVTGNPDIADGNSASLVIKVDQPDSNHNGGCLQFGPNDGYLYISFGDGGSQGDPNCLAQRGDSLMGKILRLDIDTVPYAIPTSNPFVGNASFRDEIWSIGFRNAWRFSFDRANGDMYIGDVGQQTREEVSFQPGWSNGGENYGWKVREGDTCYNGFSCPPGTPSCPSASLVEPIHVYQTNCSVIGGYVYRGCAIPDLRGTYFFGDFCTASIWSLRYNGQVSNFANRTNELQPNQGWIGNISAFGEDNCGELYIVEYAGSIYKIVAAGPSTGEDVGFGSVGSNGRVPHFDVCGRLEAGNTADFRLRDAPANVPAVLFLGTQMNPTSWMFGTLVPVPVLSTFVLNTDSEGRIDFTIPGGSGPVTLYGQYVMLDSGASQGLGFSNGLRINFP